MSKRVPVLLTLGVLMILLATTVAIAQEGEGTLGDPERGAVLYAENCLACHGPEGEPRAEGEAFAAEVSYGEGFVHALEQGVDGTMMPAWGADFGGPLSTDDIIDLMAYAATWADEAAEVPPLPTPEVPTDLVAVGAGDPNLGATLFLTYCAGCHGPTGEGRTVAGEALANFPAISMDGDVLTATRRGMGHTMPSFAEVMGGPLTETDVEHIMAYMRTWDRPSALEAAAENSPEGASMLILLIGLGAVLLVGGAVLTRSGG
ncbi:MAG: c-type cytochrome [Anaerolineae bacterium]|nr:c-type cytochrome [Anaerolineae bacterium]